MSKYDTDQCVELSIVNVNDHTRGKLRMSEMR